MPERAPATRLPDTVYLAERWYLRSDGWENVEAVLSDEATARHYLSYGYEVRRYVATATQPFRRRPLTEAEAVEAREWPPPLPELPPREPFACSCGPSADAVLGCAIHGTPLHGGGFAAVNL